MEKLTEFVIRHLNDDTSRLILDKGRHPLIDMELAVNCIESRRKLKGKVKEWYDNPALIFPLKLSAEQCSSSATARYKADLAEKIATGSCEVTSEERKDKAQWTIADLTGGLGVDSWFFSQKASKVIYNEMQPALCDAAAHNFAALEAENIDISNRMIEAGGELEALCSTDIVYMDPARRGEGGRKVFLIEDCSPDVLTLKDEIFRFSRHILINLSPMADITMVCSRLGKTCREVHAVASAGECKELLIWMDREWDDEPEIVSIELRQDADAEEFRFRISQEKEASRGGPMPSLSDDMFLFEPGKSLMKAAPFNLIASRFAVHKLGVSTHYYITDSTDIADRLTRYGKVFRIKEVHGLDKRSIKDVGKRYPKAEVTARNIPMDTETLRKKTGVISGDDAHIFGLKSDSKGNLLLVTKPYQVRQGHLSDE